MTITLVENRFMVVVKESITLTAGSTGVSGPQSPAMNVTSGWRASAWPRAHLYQAGHSGFAG